jgi:Flp pilus assembly protein TadG
MRASLLQRFRRDDRAIAAIEFAIIVPVIVALAAATLEFGMYYRSLDAVNKLASQYAIAWSDCVDDANCESEATTLSNTTLATNLTNGLVPANISIRMFRATRASSSTINTPEVVRPSGATADANEVAAIVSKAETNGEYGVVVTVTYTHTPQFFASTANTFLSSYMTMRARVAQRQ